MSHSRQADYAAARAVCVTRAEMAAMLGVHPHTVTTQIINFDLPRFTKRRHPDELRDEIVRRYAVGAKLDDISAHFGFTRSKVAGILYRAGAFRNIGRIKNIRKAKPKRPLYHGPQLLRQPKFRRVDFKARTAPVEPYHIKFMDLEPWHCREPYGDEPRTMTFCGHQVVPKLSYCPHHAAINYTPAPARNRLPRPR